MYIKNERHQIIEFIKAFPFMVNNPAWGKLHSSKIEQHKMLNQVLKLDPQ